ncbi:hypothetical protein J2S78_002109 [Salibacterium salarium]|uniref:hypothetical protein n=1 Tax=Salibacterium salarium TaxID=284579 RepID=UPI00278B4A27|nr:hypothetical protein [Salibacterium salarium]MDQ0299689.1 hypothetical protein [Salibacterium salarium]
MWVYYEEIDGELNPKWVIVKAELPEESSTTYYSISQPFGRFHEEDFHDDFQALSIDMSELVRDPFQDYSVGIDCDLIKNRLQSEGLSAENIYYDVEYFIMLCDDLEEVMSLDLTFFR